MADARFEEAAAEEQERSAEEQEQALLFVHIVASLNPCSSRKTKKGGCVRVCVRVRVMRDESTQSS
jgi:hypothetical protein